MPKQSKTAGYLVKIEAFVPAELTDSKLLIGLQANIDAIHWPANAEKIKTTITPTRR